MSLAKLSLIGLGVIILGTGAYLLISREKEAAVFEREKLSEEESGEDSPLTPASSEEPDTSSFIEILPGDCKEECNSFKTSPDQYTYCQSICGLSPNPAIPTPKPTNPNLSKDIERKNEAIKNRDLGKCGEITDANLRKSCEVRVTEDLLE